MVETNVLQEDIIITREAPQKVLLSNLKNRKLLTILALLLLLPITIIASQQKQIFDKYASTGENVLTQTPKPDIIVVMVDDLGAIDERILSRLPNIKSLWLDNGMRFDSAYSETPLCCPGRATFLTGQHTKKHGVTYNKASLLNPKTTIAVALHNAGYWTIQTGKYLNNTQTLTDRTPQGWDKVAMLTGWTGNTSSTFWVQGNTQTQGYKDRFTANKSLDWLIAAPKTKPLFMWINPTAPHKSKNTGSPYVPDIEKKYIGDLRCKGIEPWKPPNYKWQVQPSGFPLTKICESLLTVDDMVGKLKAEADKQGRDPIWIFTSDNGMAFGSDGYPMKNVPQSTRLPLYFAGPEIPHMTTNELVSNIDLGPTIADLAKTNMPWADGVSFVKTLMGEQFGRLWMLEDHPLGGNDRSGSTTGNWWGVRTPEWRYYQWDKKGGAFLFNLISDPWELQNVASSNPNKIAELKALQNTSPIITPTSNSMSSSPTLIPSLTPSPSESPNPELDPLFLLDDE